MLKTFKAILKNNSIQWLGESPELQLDIPVEVHITLLKEKTIEKSKSDGQKMAEALNKLSQNGNFAGVDPQKWQQEIRQEHLLPNRD